MSVMEATRSAQADIAVEGAPLNPVVYDLLVSAEVDSSLFVPSQFRLVFRGPRAKVLELGGLQLAVEVAVQATTGAAPVPLITGEVTAVEADYGPSGNLTVVRGLDRSHRLMRGTKTMAYPEMSSSDVVTELIADAEIPPGRITPTTVVHRWLSQANISAWAFIQQLAALENYVAYVDALGFFNFCPMTKPEAGPPPVETWDEPPKGTQLVMGKNLLRLRATVTSAEQVPEVTVMGWDPSSCSPVPGVGPALPSTAQSLDPATLPAVVAGEVGAGPFVDTSRPFDTEGAASRRAEAIAADIAGALAELEGECLGNPKILAGESVSLGMAGPPFDGQYVVSSARHVFEPSATGYSTWFTVGGRQDRSLFGLASGGGHTDLARRPALEGVVLGTVVDNNDPRREGRVKVMFPWLAPSYVSAWSPTVQMGAGKEGGYGCLFIPEVGDQVLVAFDRGNIDHPYVIGNLYSATAPPEPAPAIDGLVASRRIMSRMRHMIRFDDGPQALGITISDGDSTVTIKLDAQSQAITITSAGQVTIEAASGMSLKAGGDLGIQAGGNVSIQGAGMSVQSAGELSMGAASGVSVEGSEVSISAASISLGA